MIDVQNEQERESLHPIDIAEHTVMLSEYLYKRESEEELYFCVPGAWGDYNLSFAWSREHEILHLNLNFEMKWPQSHHKDVYALVAYMNARLAFGHLDICDGENSLLYRSALVLPAGSILQGSQTSSMIDTALEAGDRFIPALNFLLWGGKKPEEAVAAAMFETVGRA